jgi:choline monooxygenase
MNLTRKLEPQLSLPAEWYHRADIYERERREVFAREWQFLGPVSQLPNPGDYVATEITGWRVFVIRDRDGALRAFHNLCRHRAGHFVDDGQGHCDVLRCKYHGWVYDTAGRLKATPAFGEAAWFDKADYPLLPILVGEWRGLVFVNLDLDAKPLAECLGDLPELTAPYPMESFACLKQVEFEIACN